MNELLTIPYDDWRVVTLLQLALFLLNFLLAYVTVQYSVPSSVDKEAEADFRKIKDRANEKIQFMLEQVQNAKQALVLEIMKYSAPSSVDKEAGAEIHKTIDRTNEKLQLMLEQLQNETQEFVLEMMKYSALSSL
jgi:Skp family chaperone for outer membrane proteins